jgi:hypothetical protein
LSSLLVAAGKEKHGKFVNRGTRLQQKDEKGNPSADSLFHFPFSNG